MIVCVCNRLNEAKIHRAIACGAASPEQVYALNGVARNCGTCHETIDEMKHSDSLVQRILFLGGLPNLQYLDKLLIGETVEEVIDCDLKFEEKAIADLRDAITHAETVKDYGSRLLYEGILKGEED